MPARSAWGPGVSPCQNREKGGSPHQRREKKGGWDGSHLVPFSKSSLFHYFPGKMLTSGLCYGLHLFVVIFPIFFIIL